MNRCKGYFLFIILILFFSCTKEQSDTDINERFKKGKEIIFHATFSSADSKTFVDGAGLIYWNPGDSISIFTQDASDGGHKFITETGGSTAEFRGTMEVSSSTYYGLYPYLSSSSFSLSDHSFTTDLPCVQNVNDTLSTYDPNAFLAAGKSNSTQLSFANVCGGIRFSVNNPDITKVIFKSRNGEKLSGSVTIDINDITKPSVSVSGQGSQTVELKSATSLKNNGTFYYIVTVPQTLKKGFELEFYKGDNLFRTTLCRSQVEIVRSVFGTIINADEQSSVDKIIDGEDISQGKYANCYIVNKAGFYKFPAYKGCTSTSVGVIDSVKVIWETDNTDKEIAEKSIIERVAYKKGYIYFSTPDLIKNGNALIAAYGELGTVLWSWHIWVCKDYTPEGHLYAGKSVAMMDRNIGALSGSTDDPLSSGLMYQWGRKDPFMGVYSFTSDGLMFSTNPAAIERTSSSVTVEYAIAHPNTFITCPTSYSISRDWISPRDNSLWSSSKTIYDPCPSGWKVPDGVSNPWKDVQVNWQGYGIYILTGDNVKSWYPVNGYISVDGVMTNSGLSAFYWTCQTGSQTVTCMEIELIDKDKYFTPNNTGKVRAEGHSVRCIKE